MALLAIPDELLAEIFIRLPTANDVIRASRVCVLFHRVVAERSFLRRYRKLHGPPLLGFLAQRRSNRLYFHPAFVPYPSMSPAAKAVAIAADLSFSFLPARHWALCDTRDGRVLLDCVNDDGPDGSLLVETVVCDPLHRRYLLLPPIPDDLVPLVKNAKLIKERPAYETFLLPHGGGDDDEEDTSFRVICIAICRTELVTFVFASSTGQWRAGPTTRWSDLFPDVMLSWRLFSHRQYANSFFYWLIGCREKLLVLDTRIMEFSSVDAPPRTRGFGRGDIAIVEEGEDVTAMFVRGSGTSYLKYTAKRNNDGSYSQWDMVKRISLDSRYFFRCSMGRSVLLYRSSTLRSHDAGRFSLDINTLQLERMGASMLGISNTHMYSNFPPSLLSAPTVSIGKLFLHPCHLLAI